LKKYDDTKEYDNFQNGLQTSANEKKKYTKNEHLQISNSHPNNNKQFSIRSLIP
jgi:hypothetical protein